MTHPASRELRPLRKTDASEPPLSEDELRQQLVAEVDAEMASS